MHILWIHDSRFSSLEVVINPEAFPTVAVGDLLEVFHPDGPGGNSVDATTSDKQRLVVQVSAFETEAAAKQPHLQISIAQHLAALFDLMPRAHVIVRKVDKEAMRAEFLELAFRDQYIARSDMWRLKLSLLNTCVYSGKKIQTLGVRAQVKEMVIAGKEAACAYITESTKLVFRSHSAKLFIFIQMSREMWEFAEDGELFFEKCVHGFLPDLFSVWKKAATNHVVSIVLFSRIFYRDTVGGNHVSSIPSGNNSNSNFGLFSDLDRDFAGRMYRDYYRVVIDWETRSDWAQVLVPLKREFVRFEKDVLQNEIDGSFILSGLNSSACDGNILEAINLALNPFDKHYIDRDLLRTGLGIVVVTTSPGTFTVDKKLLRLTTQRMIDNGIACDLVSLARPPLYSVPLFQFHGKKVHLRMGMGQSSGVSGGRSSGVASGTTSHISGVSHDSSEGSNPLKSKPVEDICDPLYFDDDYTFRTNESERANFFNIPTWLDVSFFDRSVSAGGRRSFRNKTNFMLRCRLPEAHLIPVDFATCVIVDYMDSRNKGALDTPAAAEQNQTPYDLYDSQVFTSVSEVPFNTDAFIDAPVHVPPVGSYSTNGSRQSITDGISFSQKLLETPMTDLKGARRTSLLSNHSVGHRYGSSYKNEYQDLPSTAPLVPTELAFDKLILVDSPNRPMDVGSAESVSPTTHLAPIRILTNGARNNHQKDLHDGTMPEKLAVSFKGGTSPVDPISVDRVSPGKSHGMLKNPNMRQNYINPCNPSKNVIKASSTIRRWQHLFPLSHNHNEELIKWKSLSTPACLPISTDYFPSLEELAQLYSEYSYTVTPADETTPYQDNSANEVQRVEALLVELISQRISQGFQIVVSHVVDKIPLAPLNEEPLPNPAQGGSKFWASGPSAAVAAASSASTQKTNSARISTTMPYFLSFGDHLHKLYFDSSGKNVEVKRYNRRIQYSTNNYNYKCMIWPKNLPGYMEADVVFAYPPSTNYAWNYLDHLIAGYLDEMTEALRFWRARFILIPLESVQNIANPFEDNVDDEDIRLAGFNRFVELFEKSRWHQPTNAEPKKKVQPSSSLKIQFTTFTKSQFIKDEWNKLKLGIETDLLLRGVSDSLLNDNVNTSNGQLLTKTSPFLAIVSSMQNPGTGISIKDRTWHFKIYKKMFIGQECIDWMIRSFSDIGTREEAVDFGNFLCDKGVFQHANQKHRFLDGYFYYRISNDYTSLKAREDGLLKEKEKEKEREREKDKDGKFSRNGSTEVMDERTRHIPPIELSKRMVIDMDPQRRSTRNERAILHYDTIHNTRNCYHFQLHWLVCTPRLFEDLLQSWARAAERCGFKFVEAPIDQARTFSNDSPFQSVVTIPLACSPPLEAGVDDIQFLYEIARRNGFVLDLEADHMFDDGTVSYSFSKQHYEHTQFVHRTGAAFIQVVPRKGFLWVNNRLFLAAQGTERGGYANPAAAGSSNLASGNPELLRVGFMNVCGDVGKLESIWKEMQLSHSDELGGSHIYSPAFASLKE
ncbi:vacuolar membrane-associated protein iml1 [Rhizoclosmatium hyalinum]|nr:vacuolar membrane-associated protein iml1 [Rhizoclosmatium hyalinum]